MASGCSSDAVSLLRWSMLAACTVGPGTVVTCARSGVEYGNSLAWALCFASVLAYSLQEGSARLTLVSGKTMGQCVQEKFKTSAVGTAPRACWAFTIAVYTGCLLYQCNNFAGGVDALFAFPGMENFSQNAVRIGGCFGYGIAVIAILYQDQADAIGTGLGVVMMAMIVLFLAAAITVGFSWAELAWGFLPTLPQMSAVPDAATPCEMVLSLVGTTAIGVNLFFSGSMAMGTTMADCRRGIAFSTASALIVSLLIMIVGSGSAKEADDLGKFNIGLLADAIEHYFGKVGTFAFALGFVAAALSSMLTVVLGIVSAAEGLVLSPKDGESGALPKIPRRAFWSIAFSTVLVAMAAIIANLPRVTVILVAQLFNGILLPVYSLALLMCITDRQFMGSQPPKRCSLLLLIGSVTVTLVLAWRVIIEKSAMLLSLIIGVDLTKERQTLLIIAAVLGTLSMVLFWAFSRNLGEVSCHDSSDEGSCVTTVSGTSIGNATESELECEEKRLTSGKQSTTK